MSDNKTKFIIVRVTESEKVAIKQNAGDKTESDFIREKLGLDTNK